MSMIDDIIDEEDKENSRTQGRTDAYYDNPANLFQTLYPEEYEKGYEEVKIGDMWRWKPAYE